MDRDEKQSISLSKLWSEFKVVKHIVQGNGSPGLAFRVTEIEKDLPNLYERARAEFRDAILRAEAACPVRKGLSEHLDYHKEERDIERQDHALSREVAQMRISNELMHKSLKINIWATVISGAMMAIAIISLIFRMG